MFVQDVYSGGLLIGKVAGGKIASGRYVKLYPGGNRHRVKKVFVGNSEITTASAGDNIGAILDPAPSIAERGCLLASRKPKYVSESAATCIFIEKPAGKLSLETGYKNIPAEIKIDKGKLPIGKPVKVRIKTKYPIYVDKFVIKHQDAIIGIGKI